MPEDWQQIRTALWKRCWAAIQDVQQKMNAPEPPGFERVLGLWLDLQRAMGTRGTHNHANRACIPWDCVDRSVSNAWDRLTAPENALALECLFYQMPEGQEMQVARAALQASRKRRDRGAFPQSVPI